MNIVIDVDIITIAIVIKEIIEVTAFIGIVVLIVLVIFLIVIKENKIIPIINKVDIRI